MCDVKIREWDTPPGRTYRAQCACGWVAEWGSSRAVAVAEGDAHHKPGVVSMAWWERAWLPGL